MTAVAVATVLAAGQLPAVASGNIPAVALPAGVTAVDPPSGEIKLLDGTYNLVNVGSNKCMGVSGSSGALGASVVQWACDGTSNQSMLIRPISDAPPGHTDYGWHTINPDHTINMCLGVSGGSQIPGTKLVQWTCQSSANFHYRFIDVDGFGISGAIQVRHSNQVVGIAHASTQNGALAVQWGWSNVLDQRWFWDSV